MSWFRRIMAGRYGTDNLSFCIVVTALVLELVNLFVVSWILSCISLLLLVWFAFRAFSKNIPARQKENAKYLVLTGKIKGYFRGMKRRFQDRKTHVIFRCPSCKTKLRVPKGKGTICVTCPRCGEKTTRKT